MVVRKSIDGTDKVEQSPAHPQPQIQQRSAKYSYNTHIVQDNIVRRNAISRDKKQCLVVDLEDFANLAGCDLLDVVLAEINLGDSGVQRHV